MADSTTLRNCTARLHLACFGRSNISIQDSALSLIPTYESNIDISRSGALALVSQSCRVPYLMYQRLDCVSGRSGEIEFRIFKDLFKKGDRRLSFGSVSSLKPMSAPSSSDILTWQ